MPTPQRSQVHVNRPLTNISVAYRQSAEAFVADRVFPVIPVDKQSDSYFIFNRSDAFRDEMKERAPGTESAGGGYTMSTDTYFARVFAYHKDIDDQTRANYDVPLNADREATEYLTNKFLINREVRWAAGYFTTSIWGTDYTGVASGANSTQVNQWDGASSDPVKDVENLKAVVMEKTGMRPNVLTIGYHVWKALKNHPEIIERIQYGAGPGNPAMVSRRLVAQLFELDALYVMEAIKTTDAEPGPANASAAAAFIGGKHALLTYRPQTPGLMTPSAGYTFTWNGLLGPSSLGSAISRFRMEHLKSDRVEIEAAYDFKKIAAELGVFVSGVVA